MKIKQIEFPSWEELTKDGFEKVNHWEVKNYCRIEIYFAPCYKRLYINILIDFNEIDTILVETYIKNEIDYIEECKNAQRAFEKWVTESFLEN